MNNIIILSFIISYYVPVNGFNNSKNEYDDRIVFEIPRDDTGGGGNDIKTIFEDDEVEEENMNLRSCFSPPLECPNINVTYHFYTRTIQDYRLDVSEIETIENAPFIIGRPVKILIHGYTGSKDYQPNEIRPALLEHGEYNIISVDWGKLASSPCYIQATYNVEVAGMCTAQLINNLINIKNIPLKDIHVIGFSLGAQVSGQIAKYLKPRKLRRITGLDPAMPLFATLKRSSVLDKTDAHFVDVIHTNSGNKGKYGPNGHIDFYVNGGRTQKGCNRPEVYDAASCSHARAPIYYAESINSDIGFWAQECQSWLMYKVNMCSWGESNTALMGEFADPEIHGQYFLDTNPDPPFALGPEIFTTRKDSYSSNSNSIDQVRLQRESIQSTADSSENYYYYNY